jgi:histidyl-tRNA synthetase
MFTQQELPGIGGSLGLDRLLAAMEELRMLEKVAMPAPVFIPYFDPKRLPDYLRLAAAIRAAGIGAEVYPEPRKLGQQLKYADRRGFRVAIVAGSREFEAGSCQVKDLATGSQRSVPLEPDARSVVIAIQKILGSTGSTGNT